ncbi:uncharacterized protein VNE69_10116 [Vairimorpha necatrix]|uniref:Uncharacterized protein n=1 Tax=Vairimorpha necatrix TaxID=6039 RepID=A0AAX4JFN2_9MICR
MFIYFFCAFGIEQKLDVYPRTYEQANNTSIPLPYLESRSRQYQSPIQYNKLSLHMFAKTPIAKKYIFNGDYIGFLKYKLFYITKDLANNKIYYPSGRLCDLNNLNHRLSVNNIGDIIRKWNQKLYNVVSNTFNSLMLNIQDLGLTKYELSVYENDLELISKVLITLHKFTPSPIDWGFSKSFAIYHNNRIAGKVFDIFCEIPMNIILQNIRYDLNLCSKADDYKKILVQDSVKDLQNQIYELSQETKIYFESINEMNLMLDKCR